MNQRMTSVRAISELITKGTTPTSIGRNFTANGVRFLKVETFEGDGTYIVGKEAFIDEETHRQLSRSRLADGDVLFSIAGALGRSTMVQSDWLPANTNQALAIIRPSRKRGLVHSRYLLWALRSPAVNKRIDEINVQAAQANLSLQQVGEFEIPLPNMAEQKAIAAALDDVDALVKSLKRLLAKKLDVKQGMMQELLTGRTRLPGFTADWCEVELGHLGVFLKGRGITRDKVRSSGVPCIRYGELYTAYRDYVRETISFVDPDVALLALPIRSGDLLFAGSGETKTEIGMTVAYVGELNAVAGGDIIVLRGSGFDPIFVGALLNTPSLAAQKASRGQGDAVVHIGAGALSALRFRLPAIEEQREIAEVLQNADAEIEALNRRLASARSVKIGMMQELLTGRTRLPAKEEA